jgi:hypothetical protein
MAGTGAAFGTFIGRENRENWTVISKQLFGPGAFLIGYPREKRGTRGSVQTTSIKNGPSPAPGPSTRGFPPGCAFGVSAEGKDSTSGEIHRPFCREK